MSVPSGWFQLANSNAAFFANSLSNDVVVRSGDVSQKILVGPYNNGGDAVMVIDSTGGSINGSFSVRDNLSSTSATFAAIVAANATLSNVQGIDVVGSAKFGSMVLSSSTLSNALGISTNRVDASNITVAGSGTVTLGNIVATQSTFSNVVGVNVTNLIVGTSATLGSIAIAGNTLSNVTGVSATRVSASYLIGDGSNITNIQASSINGTLSQFSTTVDGTTVYLTGSNVGLGTQTPQAGLDISQYVSGKALAIGGTSVIDSSRNGTFSNLTILGNMTACNLQTVYSTTTIISDQIVQSNLNVFTNLAVGSNIDDAVMPTLADRLMIYGSMSLNSNAGSVRLSTNASGFLGVGKFNPAQMVDVNGSVVASGSVTAASGTIGSIQISGTTFSNVTGVSAQFVTASNITMPATGIATLGSIVATNSTFSNVTGLAATQISTTGYMGIGTSASTYPLNVGSSNASGVSIYAIGDISAFSDRRVKTDLTVIDGALAKVNRVSGYTYTRVDGGTRQAGVIAQEMQEVLPEVVHKNEDTGMLSVAYGNIVALLIQSIKELKAEKDREVSAIERRLQELEAKCQCCTKECC